MELLSLIVIGGLLWWIADSLNDIKKKTKISINHKSV